MSESGVETVLTTAPDGEAGAALARKLVEERLAACGNVIPGVRSIYRWRGAVHDDSEVLVILKTATSQISALLKRAGELHPYEVPELLTLPVGEGAPAYIRWVLDEVGPKDS